MVRVCFDSPSLPPPLPQNTEYAPEPTLGPETTRSSMSSNEYVVADSVPTDTDPEPSATITLGEEALQWQTLESESESDEEYVGEGLEVGRALQGVDEGQLDGYLSTASSVSDSDEEFILPYYRRRGTRGGRGGRRGRSGMTTGGGGMADAKPETVASRPMVNSTEDIGYGTPYPTTALPPPLLSKVEGARMLVKAGGPSLIKAHRKDGGGMMVVGGSGVRSGSTTPCATHIQPPPGLIMPSSLPRRQPPPLVKKGGEPGHLPIQPKVYHPKIVLPGSDVEGGAHNAVNSFRSAPSPSFVTAGASGGVAKVTSSPAVAARGKRRPGRPRKDQSAIVVNAQAKAKKTAHTVPYGLNKPHPKPQSCKSSRGQSSALMKGMKLLQYDYQSQQQSNAVASGGQGMVMSSPVSQQHMVASPTSQQYQPLILSSGAASTLPMTPLQIIPTAAAAHQATYATSVPQGGLVWAAPSMAQEQPTYVTNDGQLYQLIQPARSMEDDNAKKMSVIMQPQASAGGTSFVQAGEVGGFHYVTQLDGIPPNVVHTGTRGELQRKFRRLRQAVAIQQLDGLVPGSGGKGRREEDGGSHDNLKKAKRRTVSPGEASCDNGSRSCDTGSRSCDTGKRDVGEEMMSAELRTSGHLTCAGLTDNTNNNCSGEGSSEGCVAEGCVAGHMSLPSEEEPAPRKRGRPKGRGKSSKKVCSDSAVPGASSQRRGQGRVKERPSGLNADSEASVSIDNMATPTQGRPRKSNFSKQIFKCLECDISYTTRGGLTAHMITKHPPDISVSTKHLIHVACKACGMHMCGMRVTLLWYTCM